MGLKKYGSDLIGLVYPKSCYGCETRLLSNEEVLCLNCEVDLIPKKADICIKEESIASRFWGRIKVDHIYNLMTYKKGNRAQKLIYSFKYNGCEKIGLYLGQKAGDLLKYSIDVDLVVPLPLHRNKYRLRGFNQCEVFAKSFSNHCNLDFSNEDLMRVRNSETQTSKTRFNRWKNVSEIFSVSNDQAFKDKKILLVDDILTTGATIEAAGIKILSAGAKSLSILTIATAEN